jgi:hypothetical protein
VEVPGAKVVEERELVVPEEGDVEISVATRLASEEEVERPPTTDPPWPGETGEELGNLLGLDGLPGPQIGVVTGVDHSSASLQPELPNEDGLLGLESLEEDQAAGHPIFASMSRFPKPLFPPAGRVTIRTANYLGGRNSKPSTSGRW